MSSKCPTCDNAFDTKAGMRIHHKQAHGESLSKKTLTCENCGDTFEEFESRIKNGRGRFCSKGCHYDDGREVVTCVRCGETAKRVSCRTDRYDREFCSRECYLDERREGGKNAPGWIDGRWLSPHYHRKYNKTWYDSRAKALERDAYQCQGCNMSSEEHYEQYDRQLPVHHIRPAESFKIADNAHVLSNLITLCRQCHNRWEGIPLRPQVVP